MEILDGTAVGPAVISLIKNAQQYVVLVTPYFQPWGLLSTAIDNAVVSRKLQTFLVLRREEQAKKREELEARAAPFAQRGVRVSFLTRLHAKLYVSESEAIMTSLNLVESSAVDTVELGGRVDRKADPQVHERLLYVAQRLMKDAAEEQARSVTVAPEIGRPRFEPREARARDRGMSIEEAIRSARRPAVQQGACIRCADPIPLNPSKPLCGSCFESWRRYGDETYEEKHCHACGARAKTSVARPVCAPCWKQLQR